MTYIVHRESTDINEALVKNNMKMMELCLFFVFLSFSTPKNACEAVENPTFRLMEALFGNNSYSLTRDVIPLSSENSPIHVAFDFDVHKILELNEKKQVMRLNVWLRMYWQNPFLKWNPDSYGGIKKITVSKDKIWVPDLTLWNRAVNDASIYQRMDTRIAIDHDGKCAWHAPVTTTSTCAIRVKFFPFDNQTCALIFGSWRHTNDEILFTPCQTTCADMKYYQSNSEWSLDFIHGKVINQTFKAGKFSVLKCRLEVGRKSLFYVMNMVVPCTIIALLCCLTFYLPENNGERASLVITVLLAMTVYMLIVADSMPPTPEAMPLVQKFYLVTIIETAFCLFATCTVVKWNENTARMPEWVYLVFNCFLRKVLHVEYNESEFSAKDIEISSFNPSSPTNNPGRRKESKTRCHSSRKSSETSEVFPLRHYSFAIPETAPDVTEDAQKVSNLSETKQVIPRDWKLAARVLNKVFLIMFSTTFVLSIAIIFAAVKSWFQ